jgi:hypothetical protein
MGIALEAERKAALPVVKRTALGQKFYGAIVKVEQRNRLRKDEVTNAMVPVLKADGKARQELVLTCLTLPGTTAPVGLGENEFVPEPENLVRLILKGKAFSDWIATKADLNRPVEVGDVVSQITDRAQVYDAQGNASGPEITDQTALSSVPRGRSVGIYGPIKVWEPKPGSEWIEKAEAAYHSLRAPIAAEPEPPADDPWANGAPPAEDQQYLPDDEPPF